MKKIEVLAAFEREINKLDDNLSKPVTDDSVYWINQAISKFSKERFNGNAPHRTSYEQNEKRLRDLNNLYVVANAYPIYNYGDEIIVGHKYIVEGDLYLGELPLKLFDEQKSYYQGEMCIHCPAGNIRRTYVAKTDLQPGGWYDEAWHEVDLQSVKTSCFSEEPLQEQNFLGISTPTLYNTYAKYDVLYPQDLMFTLNEDVTITDLDGENEYDTSVFECTKDSFMYRITNSLTDFHYNHHKARPLRVVGELLEVDGKTEVYLYTDKNYLISNYILGYLRYPEVFNLDTTESDKYTDFTDIVLYEIVKIAAQMYLENQGDQRYKTITNEVLTQE